MPGSAPGLSAAFFNNIESVLQQNSGGTELGKYVIAASSYIAGGVAASYIVTLSRGTGLLSVTLDTVDLAPSGGMTGSPSSSIFSSSGFQVYSLSTSNNTNNRCGGNWTAQY